MGWMTLAWVLIGWCVIGLGVAYLFGRFISGIETPENADGVVSPEMSYLRHRRRAKTVTQLRAAAPPKRRASGG
jgi:hypothetical protein